MSRFKKAIKYTETLVSLDEKIAKANQEFEKTGVLLEGPANRTSGIYYAAKENPATDAVMSPVPDSSGVRNVGFTQPLNGSESDSSTWTSDGLYTDTSWLYNSNNVGGENNRPITATPAKLGSVDGLPAGAGLVRTHLFYGDTLGYLDTNGKFQALCTPSYWGTMVPPNDSEFGSYLSGAHYAGGGYPPERRAAMQSAYSQMQKLDAAGKVQMEIKFWRDWSSFWDGSYTSGYANHSGPKQNNMILQTGYIYTGANNYESSSATPPTTTVIFKDSLGKGENLDMSRFKKILEDLFGLGKSALDMLYNKPYEFGELIGNKLGDLVDQLGWSKGIADSIDKNEPYIADEPTDKELKDFFDNFGYLGLYDAQTPINDKKQNYSDDNFYVDDNGKVHAHTEQSLKDYPPTANTSEVPGERGQSSIGGRGEAQTQINQNENGDWVFSYTDHAYHNLNSTDSDEVRGPAEVASDIIHNRADKKHGRNPGSTSGDIEGGEGWESATPDTTTPNTGGMTGYPPNIRGDNVLTFEVNVNDIPNVELRNKILKQIEERERLRRKTYTLSHIPTGEVLTEKNHLRELREKKRAKTGNVSDRISKINIPGPNDELTVKAIDMLRSYKVSEKEMQEYATIIGQINQWIRDNPKEYAIWKVRYPANDPRLAELNWIMDQQLKASAEYIESRFPENQKLFDKLKQKIDTNIQVTDPANFKDVKPVVTHKKLLQVSKAIGPLTNA